MYACLKPWCKNVIFTDAEASLLALGLDQEILDEILDDINKEIQKDPSAFDACKWIKTAQEGKENNETAEWWENEILNV